MNASTKAWLETLQPSANDVVELKRIKEDSLLSGPWMLIEAVVSGEVEDVVVLLRNNYVSIHELVNAHLLHVAVHWQRWDMVQFLLQYLISQKLDDVICAKNRYGTALHTALQNDQLPIMRFLVETYPNLLHIKNDIGSPFECALLFNNLTFIDYFLNVVPHDQRDKMIANSFHFVRDVSVAERIHQSTQHSLITNIEE